jgi:dTDP-L-rhamnose 4-epimerase
VPLRIVVTGGAGFIGSRLAARLTEDGHDVVVLDVLLDQVHHGRRPDIDVEFIEGDVRDADLVRRTMQGADVVHHLAGETGVGQSQYEIAQYVGTNTYGTAVVMEEAVRAGVSQVVIASSRAVYGEGSYTCGRCDIRLPPVQRQASDLAAGQWDLRCPFCSAPARALATAEDAHLAPSSVYGITKLQQEQLANAVSAAHPVATTVLRLFNVFGPGQSLDNPYVGVLGAFFRRFRAARPVDLYEDGAMLRDFVFVDDVVDVFARCTGKHDAFGGAWNVGSGHPVTLQALAEGLAAAMETDAVFERSGKYRIGDVRHVFADMARLDGVLDQRATTTLEQGLRSFVDWALEHDSSAADDDAEARLRARNLLRQAAV